MVLRLLLLLVAPAATLITAVSHGKIVVSERGLTHLDANGSLIEKRLFAGNGCVIRVGLSAETLVFQQCRITTNPRNGTVYWFSSETQTVRCAKQDSLSQAWDLP